MPRSLVIVLLIAPALALGLFFLFALPGGGDESTGGQCPASIQGSGDADIGGPFTLVDQTGRTVTEADFLGRPMIVYFGYTYCPDVCPLGLQSIAAALDQLTPEQAAQFQTVLISVDPERDTVEQMASYVVSPAFPEGLVGLTGTPEQVDAAVRAYRAYYARAEVEGATDYLVDHSSFTYLMDSEGEFARLFRHGQAPTEVAACLQDFLEESGAPS